MFVLDTNTLIYFFKNQGHVSAHLLSHPPSAIGIPTVVLYELETGLAKSADPAKRRAQLDRLLSRVHVLPFGAHEAQVAGALRAHLERSGTPIGPMDTLIAGTALTAKSPLVTRNLREFSRVPGLETHDWYSGPPN